MKPLATLTQLKSFLGKLSYIWQFIPGLVALTTAFAPLLKKGKPFCWNSRYQQAFLLLQQLMTKLPTVCAPVPGKPLKPYLVTNNEAIGALIAKDDQEEIERSRKLKDAETRYPRAERACLALIYAAQRVCHYLLAHMIQLLTKSHPIHSLLRQPVLSRRLAQWLLQLSEFEIIAITPTAIRGQAIADLLANFPNEDS